MVYVVIRDYVTGKSYNTPHRNKEDARKWMKKESELMVSNIKDKYAGVITIAESWDGSISICSKDKSYRYGLSIVEDSKIVS